MLGVSCDSQHSHRAWSESMGDVQYPSAGRFSSPRRDVQGLRSLQRRHRHPQAGNYHRGQGRHGAVPQGVRPGFASHPGGDPRGAGKAGELNTASEGCVMVEISMTTQCRRRRLTRAVPGWRTCASHRPEGTSLPATSAGGWRLPYPHGLPGAQGHHRS